MALTYDARDVTITIGGQVIEGFAAGDIVEIRQASDTTTSTDDIVEINLAEETDQSISQNEYHYYRYIPGEEPNDDLRDRPESPEVRQRLVLKSRR